MNASDTSAPSARSRFISAAPREAALGVLRRFYGPTALGDTPSPLPLAGFQADAAIRLIRILDERGGALLADAVGLGKTHVATAVIGHSIRSGVAPVVVITPASLRTQWTRPLGQMARSLGGELALPWTRARQPDAVIEWTSHARLSRGLVNPGRPRLVVVDEAHAFRNPATRRYGELAGLCQGARVLLLTATPINNSLADLYFLFRLFLGDGDLTDLGVPDLRVLVQQGRDGVPHAAGALRSAVAAITVRRNRVAVRSGPPCLARLPERDPPIAVRYDLVGSWGADRMKELFEAIESLALDVYGTGRSGRSATVQLLRIALLKRLESSAAAFGASIRRVAAFLKECAAAIPAGRLPVPGALDIASPEQMLFGRLVHRSIPEEASVPLLMDSLRADLERIGRIMRILASAKRPDPKGAALLQLLEERLRDRSVLLFTEFHDTARHLHRMLLPRWRTGLVTGRSALLGNGRAPRGRVIEAFAPVANGVRPVPDRRLDVLVATDVLAEGFNLQDCADVVSFDLPWNPVRLVQRIGRVDRMGSPHDRIRTYNFLPDNGLESLLGLLERIRAKLESIRAAGDFDAPALASDDLPEEGLRATVDRVRRADPALLSDLERQAGVGFGIEERIHALARGGDGRGQPTLASGFAPILRAHGPGIATRPYLAEMARPAGEAAGWLVVAESRGLPRFLFVRHGRVLEDRALALVMLADAGSREGHRSKIRHPEGPEPQRAAHLAIEYLRRQRSVMPPHRIAASRAARLLLRRLREIPGGASEEDCQRADAIVARFRAGFGWGSTVALESLIDAELRCPSTFAELGDRLEALLAQRSARSAGRHPTPSAPRIAAVFRLAPAENLILEPESG